MIALIAAATVVLSGCGLLNQPKQYPVVEATAPPTLPPPAKGQQWVKTPESRVAFQIPKTWKAYDIAGMFSYLTQAQIKALATTSHMSVKEYQNYIWTGELFYLNKEPLKATSGIYTRILSDRTMPTKKDLEAYFIKHKIGVDGISPVSTKAGDGLLVRYHGAVKGGTAFGQSFYLQVDRRVINIDFTTRKKQQTATMGKRITASLRHFGYP